MTSKKEAGRPNQRRRTRKDLLQAAARLMKQGRKPSLEEVAEEALVSRATAYRYFPGVEELLVEAVVDIAIPAPDELFDNDTSADPFLRLRQVDDALHDMIVENEVPLRLMLAHSLEQRAKDTGDKKLPVRQNRRTPLIEAALAPTRKQFRPGNLRHLTAALAMIIGTEAMIVFRDVLQMDYSDARKVKRWAINALVEAAMEDTTKST